MNDYFFWQSLGCVGAVVYCSFFEWVLHRYVMHTPLRWFSYPFQAHAVTHHGLFKSDHTYHAQREQDLPTVPMAWWNAPAIWLLHLGPLLLLQHLLQRPIFWGALLVMMLYYATYESLHWCMHVPRRRNVERSGLFFRLNGHHLLHHRYMGKNLNVVLPLADLCLGTWMRRSPIAFAQARGPAVPDVQPRKIIHPDEELTPPLSSCMDSLS